MPGKTQFWLGSLLLAVFVGVLAGGLLSPKPTYSQDTGVGRAGNYAFIASTLHGNQTKSQILYVLDDRTEALYVLEATATRNDVPTLLGFRDLRDLSAKVQDFRAKKDKEKDAKGPK